MTGWWADRHRTSCWQRHKSSGPSRPPPQFESQFNKVCFPFPPGFGFAPKDPDDGKDEGLTARLLDKPGDGSSPRAGTPAAGGVGYRPWEQEGFEGARPGDKDQRPFSNGQDKGSGSPGLGSQDSSQSSERMPTPVDKMASQHPAPPFPMQHHPFADFPPAPRGVLRGRQGLRRRAVLPGALRVVHHHQAHAAPAHGARFARALGRPAQRPGGAPRRRARRTPWTRAPRRNASAAASAQAASRRITAASAGRAGVCAVTRSARCGSAISSRPKRRNSNCQRELAFDQRLASERAAAERRRLASCASSTRMRQNVSRDGQGPEVVARREETVSVCAGQVQFLP
ncbi:hypothetical protein MRX96_015961 [Rhipicephalus microplus]